MPRQPRGADQAAGDRRGCLRDLIRIGKVKLAVVEGVGRAQGEFPPLNLGVGPGDRPEEIRFSDIVVVQPVLGPCFISIGVQNPAAIGNRDAKLLLDIPLAVQGSESESLARWPSRAELRPVAVRQAAGPGSNSRRSRERPNSGVGLATATPKRGSVAFSEMRSR